MAFLVGLNIQNTLPSLLACCGVWCVCRINCGKSALVNTFTLFEPACKLRVINMLLPLELLLLTRIPCESLRIVSDFTESALDCQELQQKAIPEEAFALVKPCLVHCPAAFKGSEKDFLVNLQKDLEEAFCKTLLTARRLPHSSSRT